MRVFIRQETAPFVRKRDDIPIEWDSLALIREDAGVPSLAADPDVLLVVTMYPSAGIEENELSGFVGQAVPGTQHNFVPPIPPVKLPRSLKQLEELANYIPF
jgi:hypothetical protein